MFGLINEKVRKDKLGIILFTNMRKIRVILFTFMRIIS